MFNYNPYSYNNIFVDSIKEAEAAPVDWTGNPVFYFNKKENEVYLKQFNMQTGKTFFGKYIFTPIIPEEQPKDDIMAMLKKLDDKYNYLYERFEERENKPKKEKAVKNDE